MSVPDPADFERENLEDPADYSDTTNASHDPNSAIYVRQVTNFTVNHHDGRKFSTSGTNCNISNGDFNGPQTYNAGPSPLRSAQRSPGPRRASPSTSPRSRSSNRHPNPSRGPRNGHRAPASPLPAPRRNCSNASDSGTGQKISQEYTPVDHSLDEPPSPPQSLRSPLPSLSVAVEAQSIHTEGNEHQEVLLDRGMGPYSGSWNPAKSSSHFVSDSRSEGLHADGKGTPDRDALGTDPERTQGSKGTMDGGWICEAEDTAEDNQAATRTKGGFVQEDRTGHGRPSCSGDRRVTESTADNLKDPSRTAFNGSKRRPFSLTPLQGSLLEGQLRSRPSRLKKIRPPIKGIVTAVRERVSRFLGSR